MQYIELMQDLQLELAGEYLVMAATLAEIKSRMLLPRPRLDQDGEEDPARSWCDGCRSTSASNALPPGSIRYRAWSATCGRPQPSSRNGSCCARCRKLHCRRCCSPSRMSWCVRDVRHHHIQRERLSVGERMSEVLALLGGGAAVRAVPAAVPARRGAWVSPSLSPRFSSSCARD